MRILKFTLVFLFTIGSLKVFSQDEVVFSTQSPYHTMLSHLYFLQDGAENKELAGKTLFQDGYSDEECLRLAVMLKQLLDAKGLYVDVNNLPVDPNYLDSVSGTHKYILFPHYPEVNLEKYGDEWLYSRATVNSIQMLHDEVFFMGSEEIIDSLPVFFHEQALGIKVWQYLGSIALLLLCFLLHKSLTFIIDGIIEKSTYRKGKPNVAHHQVLKVARVISVFVVFWLLQVFVPILQLPIELNKYLMASIIVVTYVLGIVTAYRTVDLVVEYYLIISGNGQVPLNSQVVPLLRKLGKLIVIVIGTLMILQNLDFNINALLAGLSIGGLAFALAAQDTIKNFFGSILIFSDKPFKVGDWVNFDGKDGTVEEVGIRSTRIRTFYHSLIYVPNGKLADTAIDNYGLRQYRRFFTQLTITYDTPPALIEVFVDGLKEIVANHKDTRKDYYEIHLNDLGSHSLNIMFYIFFEVPSWSAELKARHEILIAVLKLSEKLGVRFAFPTTTLHMETFPGKESLTPEYLSDENVFKEISKNFINDWKAKQGIPLKGANPKV